MLTALVTRHAGRIDIPGIDDSISWHDVFRQSENLLTAVFFSRLRFLSDESLTKVLGLFIGQAEASNLGLFKEIEFWPHLAGLNERSWVEPDILIHFENATLIVEVKPPFGGGQYLEQWQAEVHSFVAECMSGARTAPDVVHFVALGRNSCPIGKQSIAEFDTQDCFKLSVHAQEWDSIISALPTWRNDCSRIDTAVFNDWEQAFDLFDLHVAKAILSWVDLLAYQQKNALSLSKLSFWQMIEAIPLKSTISTKKEEKSKKWQALLAFTRNHPLEFHTWK